ncbi:YjcZ family sporulation protein [Ureibacillus sp. MALMAid1270]|uniref:YjcZ family sporulation protein n=1 Tax=Ureibacillus sp. MALMAid1270 TaxID=3411629 RepID=UPI003BA84031
MSGYSNYDNVGGSFDRKDNKKEFVLIVVLFILLIIVGASFMKDHYYKCQLYNVHFRSFKNVHF